MASAGQVFVRDTVRDRRPPARRAAGPRFWPGHVVAARYRIERLIGRGGMGEVHLAWDCMLHERVALKTVRGDLVVDDETTRRFVREARLARRITHAGVCRIFDVGLADARRGPVPFLTMEFVPGEPLGALLHRRGPLPVTEVVEIGRQLCDALAAAHEQGVVHRDLKCDNVLLLGPAGARRAVVTDFGLARALGEPPGQSDLGARPFVGTPAYMAPEQVEGGPITPRTDLFALGLILFEMATAVLPFDATNTEELIERRLREAPPRLRTLVPDAPPRLERLIERCLQRSPNDRPASAPEVKAALERLARPRRRFVVLGSLSLAVAAAAALALS